MSEKNSNNGFLNFGGSNCDFPGMSRGGNDSFPCIWIIIFLLFFCRQGSSGFLGLGYNGDSDSNNCCIIIIILLFFFCLRD